MLVQIAMIQIVHYLFNRVLNGAEINAHAQIVELGSPYSDFYIPIVAVWFLAVARIFTQMVSG